MRSKLRIQQGEQVRKDSKSQANSRTQKSANNTGSAGNGTMTHGELATEDGSTLTEIHKEGKVN